MPPFLKKDKAKSIKVTTNCTAEAGKLNHKKTYVKNYPLVDFLLNKLHCFEDIL